MDVICTANEHSGLEAKDCSVQRSGILGVGAGSGVPILERHSNKAT
jgi:hypothetical protein